MKTPLRVGALLAAILSTNGCVHPKPKINNLAPGAAVWQTYRNGECLLEGEEAFYPTQCIKTGYLISFEEMDRILQGCMSKCD